MVNPKVSIIIPVYNGANYLDSAIRSALCQTYNDCEVLVVNDGSSDSGATQAIIDFYSDQIIPFTKENGGVATALNLGISSARGGHVLWLSHDDVLTSTAVQDLVEAAKFVDSFGSSIVYGGWNTMDAEGYLTGRTIAETSLASRFLNSPHLPILFSLVHGCSLLIPTHIIREVGGFDPLLPTTQDYDLFWRMFPKSRLVHCNRTTLYQRNHSMQGSNINDKHLIEADKLWLNFLNDIQNCRFITDAAKTIVLFAVSQHLAPSGYKKAKNAFLAEAIKGLSTIENLIGSKSQVLDLETSKILLDLEFSSEKLLKEDGIASNTSPSQNKLAYDENELMQNCKALFSKNSIGEMDWMNEFLPLFNSKFIESGFVNE